jgi:maltooligosyltrehalose trehalohydrolase
MDASNHSMRLPIGAEVGDGGGVRFRVWAPRRRRVEVVIEGLLGGGRPAGESKAFEMEAEGGGYFAATLSAAGPGTLYRYCLDGGETFPDPASRYQPEGTSGPSCVVDPGAFAWTDAGWRGVAMAGQVIYEMHVGTFTREGSWEAATRELPELAELGITVVEVMPVGDFPGRFGWGYDGVAMFAPTRLYGTPDDMRRFVDRAHALGIGVILDVVYNHFGPADNFVKEFSPYYYKDTFNEWGQALNFDGEQSGPVREFFLANAGYWIDEFHLDGLRLDATQAIHDGSPDHIIATIARHARAKAGGRSIILVAENEPQETRLVRPLDRGGYGLDAVWNDDFHHSAVVAMTKRAEGYYGDYLGTPQELISALKWGYLFQGQYYTWHKRKRGVPTFGVPSSSFVTFLENHDQVSNSARGDRLHFLTSPGLYKAMTAMMLLAPPTPMLFQGQEFAASSPFLYFADHAAEVGQMVRQGRMKNLATFPSMAHPEIQAILPDPTAYETFERSKLDLSERQSHAPIYNLYRDLLKLRREDPVFRAQRGDRLHGAIIGPEAFLLRFLGDDGDDRLMILNLGRDMYTRSLAEPLIAPPEGKDWDVLWYSEALRYGGCWAPPVETEEHWRIPGHAAVVLHPVPPKSASRGPGHKNDEP